MTAPKITETISLGNLITMLTVVASVAVGYGAQVALIEAIAARVARLEAEYIAKEVRLRTLENNSARIDEKLTHMQQSVQRIEAVLSKPAPQP
jgi:predicted nuclease with TOPRIM domain